MVPPTGLVMRNNSSRNAAVRDVAYPAPVDVALRDVTPGARVYLGGRPVTVTAVAPDPFKAGAVRVELDNGTHLVVPAGDRRRVVLAP